MRRRAVFNDNLDSQELENDEDDDDDDDDEEVNHEDDDEDEQDIDDQHDEEIVLRTVNTKTVDTIFLFRFSIFDLSVIDFGRATPCKKKYISIFFN